MILKNALINLAIPDGAAPNFIFTAITLDYEDIARLQSSRSKLIVEKLKSLHFSCVNVSALDISNSQVRVVI